MPAAPCADKCQPLTTSPAAQCRVEGNPQNRMQFRVTVAAPDAVLAAGLRDVLVAQLLAAP